MAVKRLVVILFAFLPLTQTIAAERNLDLTLGLRKDTLRWNIADSDGTPDILSELTWSDIKIAELRLRSDYTANSGWHIRATAAYGWIYDGKNQDSDYDGSGRTLESSRSNNDAKDGNTLDFSLALGHRFRINRDTTQRSIYLTPLLGYSQHEQKLRLTNGYQTIPATGSFAGLNSTYQTKWKGPWLGLELLGEGASNLRSFLLVEYHKADYYADANWNLRTDFRHPKSFEHWANGQGYAASLGVFSAPKSGWGFRLSLDYQEWKTDPGTDRTFFASGAITDTRLNEVIWRSQSINLGLHRAF